MTLDDAREIGRLAVRAARQPLLSDGQRAAARDVLRLLPAAEDAIARGEVADWLDGRQYRGTLLELGEMAAGLRPYEPEMRGASLHAALSELLAASDPIEAYYARCREAAWYAPEPPMAAPSGHAARAPETGEKPAGGLP